MTATRATLLMWGFLGLVGAQIDASLSCKAVEFCLQEVNGEYLWCDRTGGNCPPCLYRFSQNERHSCVLRSSTSNACPSTEFYTDCTGQNEFDVPRLRTPGATVATTAPTPTLPAVPTSTKESGFPIPIGFLIALVVAMGVLMTVVYDKFVTRRQKERTSVFSSALPTSINKTEQSSS